MMARPVAALGSARPFVAALALFTSVGAVLYSGWVWSPTLPSLPSPSYSLVLPALPPPVAPSASDADSPPIEVRVDRIDAPAEPRPFLPSGIVVVPSAPAEPVIARQDAAPDAQVRIGNTGGMGAFIRRTPRLADRLIAWPDTTVLQVLGETAEGDGILWINVRDPSGNLGWIPAGYVLP